MVQIHWFPGHMARAVRLLREQIKLVDIVIEVVDARAPQSTRNPLLAELSGQRQRLLILNKCDLADPKATANWQKNFLKEYSAVAAFNAKTGEGNTVVVRELAGLWQKNATRRAQLRRPRCMVIGVPNVGKSMVINRLCGRKATRTGDTPGVTRGPQWVRLGNFDLLDTPGIMWPKVNRPETGYKLAIVGVIKETHYPALEVASFLLNLIQRYYPSHLTGDFSLLGDGSGLEKWGNFALRRGAILAGGQPDIERAAAIFLRDFRNGRLGRVTLELPDEDVNGIKNA